MSLGREAGGGEVVARAQEMICAQVGCTMEQALLLINARAQSSDIDVTDVAAGVLDGSIRFD